MERYEYLSTLSSGAYGVVYKVLDRVSGRICATKGIKQAHEDAEVLRLTLREVKVLKALPPHPNVVTLVEAFRSQSGRVYLVFEFVERSLHEEMHRHPRGALPGPMLKSVAWQLLHALEHCHFHNVVHRDVKPANVLLTGYTRGVGGGGVVKLCDFGFARPVIPPAPHPPGRGETEPRVAHGRDGGEGLAMSSYVMTRWYRPPEVLVGDMYGTPIDVWSFGCTLAELASGKPLFAGRSTVDQIWRILRCLGPLPLSQTACLREDRRLAPLWGSPPPVTRSLRQLLPDVEPRLLQLITACLTLDPRKRPTVRQLLEQPYFWDVRSLLAGTDVGAQLPYINGPADLRCTITRPAVNARLPADATVDAADGARAPVGASSGKPDGSTAQAATELKATGADARAVGESGAPAQRLTAATDGGAVIVPSVTSVAASVASEASAIPLPGCRAADADANGTPRSPAPEARPPATVTAAAAAASPAAGVSITALSGNAKDDPTSSITAACEAVTSHSTAPTEAVSELMPGGSGGGGGGAAASGAWPRNLPPSLLRPPPVLLGPSLPWAARVADEAVGLSTVADSLLTSGENTVSSGGQAAAAVAPAAAAASDGVSTLEASERSQHGRVAKSVADVAAAAEAPGSPFRIPYANLGSGPGGIASPVGITAAAAAAGMAGTRPAAVGAMSPPLRASIDLMCLGSPAGAPALSTYLDRNAPLPHRRGPALPQDSLVLGSPVGTAPGSPIATTAPNNSEGLVGGARPSHVEAIQVLEHVASEAGKSEAQMLNTGVSVGPLHLLSHQSTNLSIQAGQAGGAAGGGLGTAVSGINSSTSNAYQHTLRWLGSHGVAAGPSSRAGGTIVELEAADTTALAAAAAAPPLAVASVDVHSVAGNVGGGGMGGGVSNGGSFFAVGGGGGGDVSSVWGSDAGTQTPPSAAVAEAGTVARRSWLHITSWTPGGGGGAANGGGGGGSNGGGGGTGGGGGSAVIRSWGRLRGVHGGASEGGMAPGRATSTPLGVGSCSQVPVTLTGTGTGGGVHGSQPGPPSHLTHHQAQLEPRCHHSGPSAQPVPRTPHAPHGHGANARQGAAPQHVHLHQHTHTHQHQHVHVHHVHHYQQPPQDRHAQALAVALAQAQSCAAAAAAAGTSGPGTPVTSGTGGRGNSGGCRAGGSPRGGDAGGSGAQAASPLSPAGLLALRLHSGSNGEGRTSRGRYSVDDDVRRSAATADAAAAAAVSGNGPRSVSQVELLRSGGAPAEHDQLEPAAAGQPRSPTEPCSVPNRLPMRPPGCGPLSVDQHGRVQAASELVSSTSWGCLPRAKARVVTHNRNGYVSARGGSSSEPAHPARRSAWRRLFCGLVGGGNGDQPNGLDSSSSDSATRKRFSAQPRRSSSSGDSLGPVTPRSKQLQRQLLQLQSSQMKLSSQEQTSTVSASPCGWSSRLEGAASCAPANGSSGESGFRRNSNSNTCDPFGAAEGMAATGSAGSAQATVPRQKELGTGRQSASGALACTPAASNNPVTKSIPIQFVETGLQASVACMLPAAGHQATAMHRLPGPPPASFDQPEEK
ncbi:hypothetical protein HYH03_011795 [Edaphochlamys debaryana]|uniref:cyclin-dependent kinase n=1 Tax=Edaphochlamys debaryana TaxID=47281 RepID=A0A836BUL2_9CHLO|nr:hypothetical protein HYH03_011795 [Edaphochlamys debaryana]|eukprot:KAG2489686.1 hypothetical protein HYH03_011795 [Edaphochlamys debaryana]